MDRVRFCKRYCTIWGIWEYYMIYPDDREKYPKIFDTMMYRYDLKDWCTSFHSAPPVGHRHVVELTREQCEDEIRAYYAMKELTSDVGVIND